MSIILGLALFGLALLLGYALLYVVFSGIAYAIFGGRPRR